MYCIRINTNELINHSQFQFQRVLLTKIFKEQALKFPYQQIHFLKFAYQLKEITHKNSTYLICPGSHEFPWQTCRNLHVFIAFTTQFLKTVNICQKQDATKDILQLERVVLPHLLNLIVSYIELTQQTGKPLVNIINLSSCPH